MKVSDVFLLMEVKKNVPYRINSKNKKHLLDVFIPEGTGPFPVLIFVHGGSWYNGTKDWYDRLGSHLAAKKLVAVIINYRLGNEVNYEGMAEDVANAIAWTNATIQEYKGDTSKIFISGHSAGGHLSALVALNGKFLERVGINNPLQGCILIDAFGLNMDYVMHNNQSFFVKELERVFTKDPEQWKEAAPVKFITSSAIPFLLLTGSRTYPYLTMDNEIFKMNLEEYKVPFLHKVIGGRNHVEMITSLEDPKDKVYEEIINFMSESRSLKPSHSLFQ